jgi:hypothetical protein
MMFLIVLANFINYDFIFCGMAKKFDKCEICGQSIPSEGDSPLYCSACIAEMETLNLSPKKYVKYRELKETFKK